MRVCADWVWLRISVYYMAGPRVWRDKRRSLARSYDVRIITAYFIKAPAEQRVREWGRQAGVSHKEMTLRLLWNYLMISFRRRVKISRQYLFNGLIGRRHRPFLNSYFHRAGGCCRVPYPYVSVICCGNIYVKMMGSAPSGTEERGWSDLENLSHRAQIVSRELADED